MLALCSKLKLINRCFLRPGCQARFLQDAAPSQLDHVKTALQLYLDQMKQSAHKALIHLDGTEFKDYK